MAETVHLFLKSNGKDIKGDSTQTSLGRDGSIECLYFDHSVDTAREASSGIATGRRTYQPLVIRKRIDKASPLIAKSMVNNEVIDGVFQFFRPDPAGTGTTQQFYTIEIHKGRIGGLKQNVVNTTDAEHPLEEVSFTFAEIKWTWMDGGVSHTDTWSQNT
jgi:type VI secretion system secreted protein Hcp